MPHQAQSFQPLEGNIAHTLILGTMPGQKSLQNSKYYAHNRNAFWPIMHTLLTDAPLTYEVTQQLDYSALCMQLTKHGYAVWDVLASCERPGSLDSKIVRASEQPNDIVGLMQRHPELRCIACNGRTAENLFKRHIQPLLDTPRSSEPNNPPAPPPDNNIRLISLPSTSPAMASLTLAQKYQRWADGLLE